MVSIKNKDNQLIFRFPFKSGKRYLGAAHGIIGLLHILMQLREYLPNIEHIIRPSIELVLTYQFVTGNFAIHTDSAVDDTLHFCHGAPGAVPMLCLAYQIYNDDKYLQAAVRASDDI